MALKPDPRNGDRITHADAPLADVRINAYVVPRPGRPDAQLHADRVSARMQTDLQMLVVACAPRGACAQFAALQEGIKSVAERLDPGSISSIKVLVRAVRGDAKHYREYHATPPTRS